MKRRISKILTEALFLISLLLLGCAQNTDTSNTANASLEAVTRDLAAPEWADNANIYEVNIRQYTPEGTLEAFSEHLPRLKEMGVDILWFMPIYPISEKNRKGTLGSYYAVSDYTVVNPEFGTLEEFKNLVDLIHEFEMKVILDWVPNHTGWDHSWIEKYPEYYTQDANGKIIDPIDPNTGKSWGWTDVADLDYENSEMRIEMTNSILFWINEVGIDGYRFDVASEVPIDFWQEIIPEMRAANPDIFLLAEAEYPPHRNMDLFTMSYGWSFHHLMNQVGRGEEKPSKIGEWLENDQLRFDKGYAMQFITNHDENSWSGTIEERMGTNGDAAAVLAFTFDGMPLIYSGQEAALNKRLEFFEKDNIEWGYVSKQGFYARLLELKHQNRALWNGAAGGKPVVIPTENEDIFAFYREKDGFRVVVSINFGKEANTVKLEDTEIIGDYVDIFTTLKVKLDSNFQIQLPPGGYLVLSR